MRRKNDEKSRDYKKFTRIFPYNCHFWSQRMAAPDALASLSRCLYLCMSKKELIFAPFLRSMSVDCESNTISGEDEFEK